MYGFKKIIKLASPITICSILMASEDGVSKAEEFVYRISTANEWEELQKNGSVFGGELDKSSGFIHLSNLHQVFLHHPLIFFS